MVCLWEKDANTSRRYWRLVESYGVDDDGYAIERPRHTEGNDSYDRRRPSDCFLFVGDEDGNIETFPGRLVTVFDFTTGPRLVGLNPPSRCDWQSNTDISNLLINQQDWWQYLADGYWLREQTGIEARKLFAKGKS